MSKENLEQFMSKVADSEELQAKIGEEIDTEALIALGAECGCEFNAEDWIQMCKVRNRVVGNIRAHNADRRRTKSRKEIPMWTNHILFKRANLSLSIALMDRSSALGRAIIRKILIVIICIGIIVAFIW